MAKERRERIAYTIFVCSIPFFNVFLLSQLVFHDERSPHELMWTRSASLKNVDDYVEACFKD